VARPDQKESLSPEKVATLLAAARRSQQPKRDVAIGSLLLDSGIRASELCSLRVNDITLENRSFRVQGKGNKYRECYYGVTTSKALSAYLRSRGGETDEPLFVGDRGRRPKEPLTRSGLLKLMRRLSRSAGIHPLVSVHQRRRTFAVSILRNGANIPAVQRLMGHENITVTQKHLLLAQTDIEAQHRAYSRVTICRVGGR
jgi:site-specific recombinase XerD